MSQEEQNDTKQPRGLFVNLLRGVAWFLLIPLIATIAILSFAYVTITDYQTEHQDRIFTGINAWNVDLSGLTPTEALRRLQDVVPAANLQTVSLADPSTGQTWVRTSEQLGVTYDLQSLVDEAYQIGRNGDQNAQLREQFDTWYYGVSLTPSVTVDQAYVDQWIDEIAQQLEVPAVSATLNVEGDAIGFTNSQIGRRLDKVALRNQLIEPVANLQSAEIDISLQTINPLVTDLSGSAESIQQIVSAPVQFYFDKPLDGVDLQGVTLDQQTLSQWLVIDYTGSETGEPSVSIDEVAARQWLQAQANSIARRAENARFYFDDLTEELVLIEPHANGRELDVDGTLAALKNAVNSSARSVPFVVRELEPLVHSDATGAELGIVEKISDQTTYFYDSPPERMHNIAHGAAAFYGIVIAPGEEFSFNRYVGDITEENGYLPGLIISGGRTVSGVGGGICQVSTTIYQAAFWSGLGIRDRQEHGYRVHYYEYGQGPDGVSNIGMDATIYKPPNNPEFTVDFKFTNDTEHHLLIESYYNQGAQSLTFKFYSTNIGRTVERFVTIANETDAKPDVYEYDGSLASGEIQQVDWAVGGADVTVERVVYNYLGEVRHQNYYQSTYSPWQNVYKYGPNTDIGN